jgi:hypothetical protein
MPGPADIKPGLDPCALLERLRTELVEQAFALERQGRLDAADAVLAVSGRLGELLADLNSARRPDSAA